MMQIAVAVELAQRAGPMSRRPATTITKPAVNMSAAATYAIGCHSRFVIIATKSEDSPSRTIPRIVTVTASHNGTTRATLGFAGAMGGEAVSATGRTGAGGSGVVATDTGRTICLTRSQSVSISPSNC